MKKFLLLFTVLALCSGARAQLEMREVAKKTTLSTVKKGTAILAELSWYLDGRDTMYHILYRNAEEKDRLDFESISFRGDNNALGKLYDIMKSVFSEENKKNKDYKVVFKLGQYNCGVLNWRVLGVTSVMFSTGNGYVFLTEKQVDKLFNRD